MTWWSHRKVCDNQLYFFLCKLRWPNNHQISSIEKVLDSASHYLNAVDDLANSHRIMIISLLTCSMSHWNGLFNLIVIHPLCNIRLIYHRGSMNLICSRDANPPYFRGRLPIFVNTLSIFWHPNWQPPTLFLAGFVLLKLHVILKNLPILCLNAPIFWMLMLASLNGGAKLANPFEMNTPSAVY